MWTVGHICVIVLTGCNLIANLAQENEALNVNLKMEGSTTGPDLHDRPRVKPGRRRLPPLIK